MNLPVETTGEDNARRDASTRDYYIERGRVVFTAQYHLKRGSCCGSGCRHCPYGNESEQHSGDGRTR